MPEILTTYQERVYRVTMNRPEKRNAMNPALVSELHQAFDALPEDALVVVLTGAGSVFSAGADLSHIQALSEFSHTENVADSTAMKDMFLAIYQCPVPVIAAVNGHAIAGGAGLTTVCDIVLMSESAKIGYTEVKIGFVAALVMVFLREQIGAKRANWLLYSGQLIDAKMAVDWGLANQMVADNHFTETLENIITRIAQNAPAAVRQTKQLLRELAGLDLESSLNHAAQVNANARQTGDCKEGIAAFLEKRKPRW